MNFGLSGYLAVALAAALAVAGAASWAALHEYGVAKAQASRDRAQIAQAQAQATAAALKQQQVIDAAQAAKVAALQAQSNQAIAWLAQYRTASSSTAHAATRSVRTIIRHEAPSACARQPIPAPILAQLRAGA